MLAPVASGKSLLERIEERGRFPSAGVRSCTSDHKRGPIERELRRYLKSYPRFEDRVVSAIGLRCDESAARAKRVPWKRNDRNSRAGREWFDWLPVFSVTTPDVFRVIAEASQKPHWGYSQGVRRYSCSFCMSGSRADSRRAAELRPGLYRRYTELEQRIGHTLSWPSRPPAAALGLTPHAAGCGAALVAHRYTVDDGRYTAGPRARCVAPRSMNAVRPRYSATSRPILGHNPPPWRPADRFTDPRTTAEPGCRSP